jgi:hypothetical protein
MDWAIIWSFAKECITYIVPLFALLLSVVSLCISAKSQKLQNRVSELELKIKEYEVAEVEKKKTEAGLACIEARVIHISGGEYRLKVWNSGQATAYKVSAIVDKNANLAIMSSKMPFDFLEAGKSFEEHLIVHMGTADKFKIVTTWEDAAGQPHQKEQMGSL